MRCPSPLWAITGMMLVVFIACGGEDDATPTTDPGCRLNSDCPVGQLCQDSVCVVDEGSCEGPDCPCVVDSDCSAGEACDADTGACFELACLKDADCALGEVCEGGLCLTDVNADRDRDGVPDAEDNCPETENTGQDDNDGDLQGDTCDSDDDNDAVPDTVDNCPETANTSQADANQDALGNACDPEVQGTTVRGKLDFSAGGDPNTSLARVFITGREEPVSIDAEGNFVFDQALPEGGAFTIRAVWPGFEIFSEIFRSPSDVEFFDIEPISMILAPATMLGRATLQSQEDHSGTRVQAFVGEVLVAETTTDERGFYIVSASEQDHDLRFSRLAYLTETISVAWQEESEQFQVDGEDLSTYEGVVLRPDLNAALTGVLTSPVPNLPWPEVATVALSGGSGGFQEAVQGDGSFQFSQLQPDLYQLDITVQGHRPRSLTVQLGAGPNTIPAQALELALIEPLAAAIRLEGRQDHGGALVRATVAGSPVASTLTDSGGAFEISAAALDTTIIVSAPAFETARVDLTWNRDAARFEVDGTPLDEVETLAQLSADRSASISGLVQTPTGLPEIAAVRLLGEFETLLGTVGPDGAFQIAGVQPGLYVLEVTAEGHLTETRILSLGSGQAEDTGTIALRLENEDEEQAVVLAGVARLSGRTSHGGILVEARIGQALVDSTLTNAAGAFAFQASRTTYTLHFSSEGFLTPAPLQVSWDDDETRFEVGDAPIGGLDPAALLQPDASGAISGTLESPLDAVDWPSEAVVRLIGQHDNRQIGVLAGGTFQIDGLQPGLYGIEIAVEGHSPLSREVAVASNQSVDLGTLNLTLALIEPLLGVARLEGRESHQGIAVEARIGQTLVGTAVTDGSGSFRMLAARTGHTLTFNKENHISRTVEIVWNDGASRFDIAGQPLEQSPQTLSPARTARLRGSVTSPIEGIDWPNIAVVTLTGQGERRTGGVLPDGSFSFDLLQPGFYAVEITAQGHLPASRAATLGSGETIADPIPLVPEFEAPEEAVVLRGQARLQGRTNHLGIVVQALVGGIPVGSAVTDEDGKYALTAARLNHRLRFVRADHQTFETDVVWSEVRERFEVAGQPLTDFAGAVLQPLLTAGLRGRLLSPIENINWAAVNIDIALVGEQGEAPPPGVTVDRFAFSGLAPGLYGLQIQVEGHVPYAEVVRLSADEAFDIGDVRLSEEAEAPETAVNLQGAATLSDARTPDQILVRLIQNGVPVATTLTNDQGRFGFLASRVDYRLELTRPSYGPQPVAVDVIWNRNAERFEVGGQPLTDFAGLVLPRITGQLTVTVDIAPDWVPQAQRTARIRVVGEGRELTEEAAGDGAPVVFPGLEAGNYVVFAERQGFTLDQAIVSLDEDDDSPDVDLQIALADLAGAGLDLRGVTLSANDLGGISLLGANLSGVSLRNQDLRNLDMTGVTLTNADLSNANLSCTRLDDANLFGADLSSARMFDTSMRFAALSSANLTGAFFSDQDGPITCNQGNNPPNPDNEALFLGTFFAQAIMSGTDLRGVDLQGADLSQVTLTGANISGADMTGVTMILANLTDANARNAIFDSAIMLNAILFDTDLRGASMRDALLNSAIIDGALFDNANLLNANFTGTTLSGTSMQGADATGARFLSVSFDGDGQNPSNLDGVIFDNAQIVGALFNNVNLSNASFGATNLRGTVFVDAQFDGAAFVGADMRSVNLIGANLRGVNLQGADLSFALLARALTATANIDAVLWDGTTCPDNTTSDDAGNTCVGHLYAGANCDPRPNVQCREADLSGADLRGTDFSGANLINASFSGADVRGVDFSGAVFRDTIAADFSGALLDNAIFIGADIVNVGFFGATGENVVFRDADMRAIGISNFDCARCDLSGADLGSNTLQHLIDAFETPYFTTDPNIPGYNLEAVGATIVPSGFAFVPAGRFVMGSSAREPGHRDVESPQHTTVLTRPLLVGVTEVTQGQWSSAFRDAPDPFLGENHPVAGASWYEALLYCNALSERSDLEVCYDLDRCTGEPGADFTCPDDLTFDPGCEGYRLPTEAEWEFFARAGSETAFHGGQITEPFGIDPLLDTLGWYQGNVNNSQAQSVAQKLPNAWGLFDIHGNVFEWVWDWENFRYGDTHFVIDPIVSDPGDFITQRIIRGGGFHSIAMNTRSAFRDRRPPADTSYGFRVVRSLPAE